MIYGEARLIEKVMIIAIQRAWNRGFILWHGASVIVTSDTFKTKYQWHSPLESAVIRCSIIVEQYTESRE
jgi:hypothetical protein